MGFSRVLGYVIEFPLVARDWVDIGTARFPWRARRSCAGDPAIAVDTSIPQHLKILRRVRRRRVWVIERIHHADTLKCLLIDAIYRGWRSYAHSLVDRRHNIDDVMPLRAHLAGALDSRRPGDHEAVGGSSVVRGNLLIPLKWGIHGVSPTYRV